MTVAELIAKLQTLPHDAPVVMSDKDGNVHMHVFGVDDDLYLISSDQAGVCEVDEDAYRGGTKCVVLWP